MESEEPRSVVSEERCVANLFAVVFASPTRTLRKRWSSRYIGLVATPIAATLVAWAICMIVAGHWSLFRAHGFMTLTMVAGSFVAGGSSEEGGGVPCDDARLRD